MVKDILPEDLTREMDKLKQQLQVVSKRLSAMIMRDLPTYSSQLKDIDEIQKDLDSIISVIQSVRKLVFFPMSSFLFICFIPGVWCPTMSVMILVCVANRFLSFFYLLLEKFCSRNPITDILKPFLLNMRWY